MKYKDPRNTSEMLANLLPVSSKLTVTPSGKSPSRSASSSIARTGYWTIQEYSLASPSISTRKSVKCSRRKVGQWRIWYHSRIFTGNHRQVVCHFARSWFRGGSWRRWSVSPQTWYSSTRKRIGHLKFGENWCDCLKGCCKSFTSLRIIDVIC